MIQHHSHNFIVDLTKIGVYEVTASKTYEKLPDNSVLFNDEGIEFLHFKSIKEAEKYFRGNNRAIFKKFTDEEELDEYLVDIGAIPTEGCF